MTDPMTPICPDCRTDDEGESYVCNPTLSLCLLNRMTADPTGPNDCPTCGNSGWVRVANKRPYLSWAYEEWDEPCPDCAAARDRDNRHDGVEG